MEVGRNDVTKHFTSYDIKKNDTVKGSAAREIIADSKIEEGELKDALGIKGDAPIVDVTSIKTGKEGKTQLATMKSDLTAKLEGLGFKKDAAEQIADKIIKGYQTTQKTTVKTVPDGTQTVPDGTEMVQVGEKTTFTGVIDRKSWEAGIVKAEPPGWKPPFYVKGGGDIKAFSQANFTKMIDKFGPSNPTGQQDFRTAIHNGFPNSKISDAECDQLLNLMQNAASGADIKTIQTLLCKIDPKFAEVLNQNGGVDGKLGYKTMEACRMLDAAVGMVEKKEPIFEPRPKTKEVPKTKEEKTVTVGDSDITLKKKKFKIDLPEIHLPKIHLPKIHIGGGHKNWGSVKCPKW
jgi:hypothetical protein